MTREPKNPPPGALHRVPLHQQIAAILREDIATRQPGEKLEAESRLAERFKVSVLTVREALSSLAQDGLVVRRHGSGTYVGDRAARGHVAVLVDKDIADPRGSFFFLRVVQRLRERLEAERPTRLYLGRGNAPGAKPERPNCPEFNADAEAGRIAAVCAVSCHAHPRWLKPLAKRGVPVVGDLAFPLGVGVDHEALIKLGVERLATEGRARIAVLGFGVPDGAAAKLARATIAAHGLSARDGWIRFRLHQDLLGAGWEEIRALWSAEREKPDGLLVTDDLVFNDAATAIAQLGVDVPRKLLVVAHGNRGAVRRAPFPTPRLLFDADAYADAMVDLLLARLAGEKPGRDHVLLPPTWSDAPETAPRATTSARDAADA